MTTKPLKATAELERLLTDYGSDEKVTRALDTRTFYVVPRLNPDGAELALSEQPRYVRSSVRKYPLPEREDGLQAEDVDGDGRVLTMRLRDPNGNWKPHPEAAAVMVRREPDEDRPREPREAPHAQRQRLAGGARLGLEPAAQPQLRHRDEHPHDEQRGTDGVEEDAEQGVRGELHRNVVPSHRYHRVRGQRTHANSDRFDLDRRHCALPSRPTVTL